MLNGNADRRLTSKGRAPRQQVVASHAKGVDVTALVQLATFDLLGTHVERRPHGDADLRQVDALARLCELSQTEVRHFDLASAGHHDVLRFDVAVDDSGLAGNLQGAGNSPHDVNRHRQRGRPLAVQKLAQVQTMDVLLRDVMNPVLFSHSIDLDDARVIETRGRPRLTFETFPIRLVRNKVGAQDLHRHLTLQRRLFGQVDLGHPAASQTP